VRAAFRSFLKPLHAWIGLLFGLLISVAALTGSVILFRAELERATLPRSITAPGTRIAPLDFAVSAITKLRPDGRIRRVHLPASPYDPYIFQVESRDKHTEKIASDAVTGEPLGIIQSGWIDWLIDLHRNLLTGKQGRRVVGFVGLALFLLSLTGCAMWAAGARRWKSWLTIRRQGSNRRFLFELHRTVGLWAFCVLAVMSVTGMERAFPETFRGVLLGNQASRGPRRTAKNLRAKTRLQLGDYVRIGRAAMPDGAPVELRLGGGPVELRLRRAGDIPPAANYVYLNPANGELLGVDRLADRPLAARVLADMEPIHYALWGGTSLKITWALFALTPVLLFITGLMVWLRTGARKPDPQAAMAPDLELADVGEVAGSSIRKS